MTHGTGYQQKVGWQLALGKCWPHLIFVTTATTGGQNTKSANQNTKYANQNTKYANQNTKYAKQNTNYAISIKRVWQKNKYWFTLFCHEAIFVVNLLTFLAYFLQA